MREAPRLRPGPCRGAGAVPRLRSRGAVRRAVVAGVALATLSLVGPALADAPLQCPPAGAVLTVRGTASVAQAPDAAALTVSVVTRGAGLDVAMRGHEQRVAKAKAVLDGLAAAGLTVEAAAFSLGEEAQPTPPGGRPGAVPALARAETRFDLTLRDLAKLDAVVGDIAAAGLFEVESARFVVADDGPARDRARRAAMADARHQAEIYADAGALRLDAIERIADAAAVGAEAPFAMPLLKARSASVGIMPPRTLSFEGSVTVTWRVLPR